jgi:hypothetical protein
MFHKDTLLWSYATTTSKGTATGTDAVCYLGNYMIFSASTNNCSIAGDICTQLYVTGFGQFVSIAGVGFYWPGGTTYFGATACSPASASQQVCCGAN